MFNKKLFKAFKLLQLVTWSFAALKNVFFIYRDGWVHTVYSSEELLCTSIAEFLISVSIVFFLVYLYKIIEMFALVTAVTVTTEKPIEICYKTNEKCKYDCSGICKDA